MSYSQSTTHYNWPLPQEIDLFNGLDDNPMKEELDQKVYELEQTSQDDHAAVVELSGRVQEVEQTVGGYDQTIEAMQGTLSEHAERLILLTNRQTELSRQLKTKASESTIAPEYNEEESYSIGDLVYHSNILYEANAAIVAPAGDFDPTKWDIATIASKLGGGAGAPTAADVSYNDVVTQLGANNVQGAIAALKDLIDSIGGGGMELVTTIMNETGTSNTYTLNDYGIVVSNVNDYDVEIQAMGLTYKDSATSNVGMGAILTAKTTTDFTISQQYASGHYTVKIYKK